MSYRQPDFNLLCNIWTCDGVALPSDGPQDYVDIPCQKYVSSRSTWPTTPPYANGFFIQNHPPIQLRFPRIPPFNLPHPIWTVTVVECPSGSGQYYRTFWKDIQHEGFTNEYALLVVVQCDESGLCLPPGGSQLPVGMGQDPCGVVPAQRTIDADIPGSLLCCDAVPPPADTFLDTFTGSVDTPLLGHTSDSGQTWGIADTGMLLTGTNGVYIDYALDGDFKALIDFPALTDAGYNLAFVTPTPGTDPVNFGLLLRMNDPDTGYAIIVKNEMGTWSLELCIVSFGVLSSLQTVAIPGGVIPGNSYNIICNDLAGDISASLQDISGGGADIANVEVTDTTFTGGTLFGMWFRISSTEPTVAAGTLTKIL